MIYKKDTRFCLEKTEMGIFFCADFGEHRNNLRKWQNVFLIVRIQLSGLKFPSRQNPQIQETNFGNLVSCIGNSKVLQLRKLKKKK